MVSRMYICVASIIVMVQWELQGRSSYTTHFMKFLTWYDFLGGEESSRIILIEVVNN